MQVAGKSYRLHLDFNALCEFEDAIGDGTSALDMFKRFESKQMPTAKQVRALAYAVLRKHHREVGLEEAGNLVSALGMENLSDAVSRAFGEPEKQEGGAPVGPPETPGTGESSSLPESQQE